MKIPEKLKEILQHEGIVTIITNGKDGAHPVNTWNHYIAISADERLLIPAGRMHKTENNLALDPNVQLTLGSSKVEGQHGPGTGYLLKGKASMLPSGPEFDQLKSKFGWLRAVLAIEIDSAEQTL